MRPWVFIPQSRPKASLRLFCFAHAGGSASQYYTWAKALPQEFEMVGVQLPGRGSRIQEASETQFDGLLDAMERGLSDEWDRPFAFFGHSLGGILAFELARKLNAKGNPPLHVIVSAVRAASLFHDSARRNFSQMTDPELRADMKLLGGTPAAMLENEELVELILPILRADYALIESYRYYPTDPMDVPLTVMAGLSDPETTRASVQVWKSETRQPFAEKWYPGDHFFIQSQESAVIRDVVAALLRPPV